MNVSHKRMSIVLAVTIAIGAGAAICQEKLEPTGGKLSEMTPAANSKSASKSASKSTPRSSTKSSRGSRSTAPKTPVTSAGSQSAAIDIIDGKWWTSGNDFGKSQVYFTQEGGTISGAIMYADGRTGTLTGTLSGRKLTFTWNNSSGDHGSGWLEQSWNNFMGGSYTNARGAAGSWTLSRVDGNWCFAGSRDRIRQVTHNARGQLWFLTPDSGIEVGHLEGPFIFLHGQSGNIKGTMYYQGNRVDFDTGAYWTWCGRRPPRE
jgi:hypothetical protein